MMSIQPGKWYKIAGLGPVYILSLEIQYSMPTLFTIECYTENQYSKYDKYNLIPANAKPGDYRTVAEIEGIEMPRPIRISGDEFTEIEEIYR